MNAPAGDTTAALRWSVYGLLIAIAVGSMLGRVLAVNSVDLVRLEEHLVRTKLQERKRQFEEQGLQGDALSRQLDEARIELKEKLRLERPFLSANDRSRWATVRSLVEHGTYAIDDVASERGWDTIDMVQHRDRTGEKRLYSSKPPLLATLIAVPYWIIYRTTGFTLGTHPYEIGRLLLILVNVLPLGMYFWLTARMAERLGTTDWGRIFVIESAMLGTFLTTFAVVLNNHVIAAVSAAIALEALVRIWYDGERRTRHFVVAGLAAAFTAANELPALLFLVLVSGVVGWIAPRQTFKAFLPAVLVVVAAFFATNYAAHDSLLPPYMHRSETNPDDNWYSYSYVRDGQTRRSYWESPSGIDRGEASPAVYALHVLIGHHGVFSLTPIWLLSMAGIVLCWTRGREWRHLATLIATVSLICLVFFLLRPQIDRNYGGMTSGFRWMFWLAPLWLVAMLPAADAMAGSRWKRGFALVLLALSVLSASFPTWNPWTHPWITRFFLYLGWIEF